jgi:hypothetical protein
MPRKAGRYVMPPRLKTQGGDTRRVGYELEFAGLEFKETVAVLAKAFGVDAKTSSQAEATITHPEWGDFIVEVDSELAKDLARDRARQRREKGESSVSDDPLAEWIVNLTTELVPVEVVCPPIDMDAMSVLDDVVEGLRAAGAEGTAGSLVYAFGLHINPELPALEPAVIGRYLKAYVIAQDWLLRRHHVDLTRRITPYIDLYPSAYRRKAVAYGDDVTLDKLLTDYLAHNATRNRALDMLPLFKHLAEDRVSSEVTDTRIKARPTFHYRLPNCEIDKPGWHLSDCWNIWCVLEAMADDADLLDDLAEQYRRYDANLINLERAPWHKTLDKMLDELVSA